jgi:CubicO group peptidase (beta-lactamase class C family)
MRYWLALAAVLIVAFSTAHRAQTDTVDDFISAEMRQQRIPGMSIAVIKDGVVVKAAGYGYADVARKIPSTPDTVYKIGSLTKQFIAAGVMLLVQQGRITLDSSVADFLPKAPPAWKPITIRHLLTHTSGLKRDVGNGNEYVVGRTDAELVDAAFSERLVFTPGARGQYSNLGYIVLGEVIRSVTRKPWNDYLAEEVFTRAGLRSTAPYTQAVPGKARGYSDNDKWRPAVEWKSAPASGSLQSSVSDLARWDIALSTASVLTDASRAEMWTSARLNDGSTYGYGFGWGLSPFNGHRRVSHSGGLPGFISHWWRFLDARVSVIVLMNVDDADAPRIVQRLAAAYLPSLK